MTHELSALRPLLCSSRGSPHDAPKRPRCGQECAKSVAPAATSGGQARSCCFGSWACGAPELALCLPGRLLLLLILFLLVLVCCSYTVCPRPHSGALLFCLLRACHCCCFLLLCSLLAVVSLSLLSAEMWAKFCPNSGQISPKLCPNFAPNSAAHNAQTCHCVRPNLSQNFAS